MTPNEITMDPLVARDAGLIFFGSRDFLLAWELLEQRHQDHEVRVGRAPWPMRAWATCAALSLELALKARLRLEGKQPKWVHTYSELFSDLSVQAKEDIASRVQIDGRPVTIDGLLALLKDCDGTFEQWRYLHEQLVRFEITTFHGDRIVAITRAIHASIVQLRRDFDQWPGVMSNR